MIQLSISDRDQALFEAGIKLGALYHQFIGTPLTLEGIPALEKTIEESIGAQPFTEQIQVRINPALVKKELNDVFQYTELKGSMLFVTLRVRYNTATVTAILEYDERLNYPLMRIHDIQND
ncbi:MAG: dihydroneopterin aldolase family protein [Methanimicrococcus sp.]|nr:dihydroneopterin aldolase family protein [Methanimicrococcus sp.]